MPTLRVVLPDGNTDTCWVKPRPDEPTTHAIAVADHGRWDVTAYGTERECSYMRALAAHIGCDARVLPAVRVEPVPALPAV